MKNTRIINYNFEFKMKTINYFLFQVLIKLGLWVFWSSFFKKKFSMLYVGFNIQNLDIKKSFLK